MMGVVMKWLGDFIGNYLAIFLVFLGLVLTSVWITLLFYGVFVLASLVLVSLI
jgi:hypothetical protein